MDQNALIDLVENVRTAVKAELEAQLSMIRVNPKLVELIRESVDQAMVDAVRTFTNSVIREIEREAQQ